MCHVFFGKNRLQQRENATGEHPVIPHESPASMLMPLRILAGLAIVAGFVGTPIFPWFRTFLEGGVLDWHWTALFHGSTFGLLVGSSALVIGGLVTGWWFYSSLVFDPLRDQDPLDEKLPSGWFSTLRAKFYLDEFYESTVIEGARLLANGAAWFERHFMIPMMQVVALGTRVVSWISRFWDEWVINAGFDRGCKGIQNQAERVSNAHTGRIQLYLQVVALGFVVLTIIWIWGGGR
jgi:NADH-quinone oxidoreductase subunit L